MANLDDKLNSAAYQQQEALSKSTIFLTIIVFIATSLYLVLFSDTKPGPSITGKIIGIVYFFFGWLAIVFVISLPLYLFLTRVPRIRGLTSLVNIVLTIFLTRAFYLWLFAEPSSTADPYVVVCPQPIPEFTLGPNSNSSEAEIRRLCSCIWAGLNTQQRNIAQAITSGRSDEVSASNRRGFSSRFGSVVERCGGLDL